MISKSSLEMISFVYGTKPLWGPCHEDVSRLKCKVLVDVVQLIVDLEMHVTSDVILSCDSIKLQL